jgi:hypothetical protein
MVTAARGLLPGTEVSPHVSAEEEMLELLATGRLEFGLGVDYPGYELPIPLGLAEAVLAVQPVFVLLSKEHSLASRDEIPLEALAGEQWFPCDGKDIRMRAQFHEAGRVQPTAVAADERRHQLSLDWPGARGVAVPSAGRRAGQLRGCARWPGTRCGCVNASSGRTRACLRDSLVTAHRSAAESSPPYRS